MYMINPRMGQFRSKEILAVKTSGHLD